MTDSSILSGTGSRFKFRVQHTATGLIKTWIREHSSIVQMQSGNYIDYPMWYQLVANAADTPLSSAPQGGAVKTIQDVYAEIMQ